MYICRICWDKYYESDLLQNTDVTGLCEICNKYRQLCYRFAGKPLKNKEKKPVLAKRKLRRIFVWAKVPDCRFGDNVLGQLAEDVLKSITILIKDALNVGYTNIRFECNGDYDGSWYEAYGIRPETDIEMRRRFKEIRRSKARRKRK